jgi:hypothetical protein
LSENVPSAWVAGVEAAGMKIGKRVSRGGREIPKDWRSSSCLLDGDQSLAIGAAKIISHVATHFVVKLGLRQLARQLQSISPVIVSEREVGINPNGAVAILHGLFELALIRIGSSPIGVSDFVLWIESDGA